MSDTEDSRPLSDRIHQAIVNADCYCKPGDPTCEDWKDAVHRWDTIHKSVMNVIDSPPQSNLVDHARVELVKMGEDSDVIEWYLRTIQAFASYGHSGGSASVAIPVLNELLQFKNITPLTDDPDEWIHHGEDMWGEAGGIWQNKRNSEAFSQDAGKTYYLISEGGNDRNPIPSHESKKTGT